MCYMLAVGRDAHRITDWALTPVVLEPWIKFASKTPGAPWLYLVYSLRHSHVD